MRQRGSSMHEALKVTLLLPYGGFGGGVRAVMRLGNELTDRGHSVRILARQWKPSAREKLRNAYIALRYGDNDWLRQSKAPVFEYSSLRDFSFNQDELVVAMCARTSFDLMELDRDACIPVYQCHGSEIENWDNMMAAWNLPTRKLAVCPRLAAEIEAETGQKCYGVVPNGVDLAEYHPSGDERSRTAVGAGYHDSYTKDPGMVCRVFGALEKRLPTAPRLSFGSGKKPKALRNAEYARLPSVERARGIYSRCRVWFHTSIREGFGLPVLEAMACGCAVVVTDSGGPSALVENGKNGFLVDIGNFGLMAFRIARIFEDDALYAKLRENGLKTAERYSWTAAGAAMEEKLRMIRADAVGGDR
jgi:glycosyltransferase involved in cell wall biosynthesis